MFFLRLNDSFYILTILEKLSRFILNNLFKNDLFFNVCVYKCFACIFVCVLHVCLVPPTQGYKRVSDSLELELQMTVSCHVDARNQPRSSARTAT